MKRKTIFLLNSLLQDPSYSFPQTLQGFGESISMSGSDCHDQENLFLLFKEKVLQTKLCKEPPFLFSSPHFTFLSGKDFVDADWQDFGFENSSIKVSIKGRHNQLICHSITMISTNCNKTLPLNLMIHSLYSQKEIFLRELISNASDALDRARFLTLSRSDLRSADGEPSITLSFNKALGTITVSDNGIGLTREEAIEHLGTIARSGTKAFAQLLKEKGDSAEGLKKKILLNKQSFPFQILNNQKF